MDTAMTPWEATRLRGFECVGVSRSGQLLIRLAHITMQGTFAELETQNTSMSVIMKTRGTLF